MKIYTAAPLPVTRDSWDRDITLLYRGLMSLGGDSQCVRLQTTDGADFPGVIQTTRENMCAAAWWRRFGLDAVVLNSWGDPRHTPVVRAIKEAGARVLVRLDTNGINSPWVNPCVYAKNTYSRFRARGKSVSKALPATVLKCMLYAIPWVYDRKSLAQLDLVDFIGAESEEAYHRMVRLMKMYGVDRLCDRLHIIRHPAAPDVLDWDITDLPAKEKSVIAVGRWNSYWKNAPLLVAVLAEALRRRPDYHAHVIGAGREVIDRCLAKMPLPVRERIHVHDAVPHGQVVSRFQRSQICISTSRGESGPIVASEALCCGCTFFAQDNGAVPLEKIRELRSGGGVASRSPRVLAEGLVEEMRRWDRNEYDPEKIARDAREVYSCQQVARKILSLFSDAASGGRQALAAGGGGV